ncbi:hypothetical protein HYV58_01320, partial [Candidatus Peregrinibacteria bacterium]|nr:hypothetical protein [Candidatus Peregrinibacteria bacterium]
MLGAEAGFWYDRPVMNFVKWENPLVWILRIGIVATLFSTVVVSFDFFFPYIAPRAFFFQLVTAVLAVVSLAIAVFFPHRRPRGSLLVWAVLAYAAVLAVSTLSSSNPMKSFVGTVERSFGVFHIFHIIIVFFAALLAFQKPKEWRVFFWINVVWSLYPALDFIMPILMTDAARGNSIMGNQTFLAAYLLLQLFFALHLLISGKKHPFFSGILVLIMSIQVATILATGVRGAFLGLSTATLFFFFWGMAKSPKWRV